MPRDPCSELAKTITQLAMAHGEHSDVKNLDDVVKRMQKDIPEIGRAEVVSSIIEATTGHRDAATELEKKLADLRREARNDKAVRDAVDDMRKHVAAQTQPAKAVKKPAPEAIRKVRVELAGLRKQVEAASPQRREVVKRRIEQIEKAIAAGEQLPPRPKPQAPADLQALRDKRDALRQQMRAADPSKRAELRDRIKAVDDAIASGKYPEIQGPPEPPRPAGPLDGLRKELAKKQAELEKLNPERIAKLAEREKAAAIKQRQTVEQSIRELEGHLKAGTIPPREAAAAVPADLAALRKQRDELRAQVMQADPAKRADLRRRIDELQQAIDAGQYPAKPTTPPKAPPADLAALRTQRDELRTELERLNPKRLDDARARIAELEGHLKAGTLPEPKERTVSADPPELVALRDTAEQLRQAIAKSEPALRQKFQEQIDALTARIEDGVSLPEAKAEPRLSPELERLQFERDKLRRAVRQQINDLRPRTFWGKVGGGIAEAANLARSLMTSLDFSAVFRQGGFIALGNPARAARSLGPMFKAFASERSAYKAAKEIEARPNAPLYKRSGLYLAEDANAPLSKQEESFMSRLAGKIPGVAGSQRAYTTFLNKLRADSFDAMTETLARNGEATTAEAEAIANFINVATGRAPLGKTFEQAGPALATAFFAPRYVVSRFQLLAGQPIYGGTARTRKLIAAEYGKYMTGLAVVLGLGALAGGELESDPRSSDFGKIRFGNTTVDPLSGLAQATTLVSRLASGSKVTGAGKVEDIRGELKFGKASAADVFASFARSKLAPALSAAVDLASGTNAVGEPVSPLAVAGRMMVPISFGDILAVMKEHNVPEAAAMTTLSLLGMGVQNYDRGPAPTVDRRIAELENAKKDPKEPDSGELKRLRRFKDRINDIEKARDKGAMSEADASARIKSLVETAIGPEKVATK